MGYYVRALPNKKCAKGHALENISAWMGHSTLERTWKSYKQRKKYHIQASVPW
jgi:hypothetical protein